MKKIVIGTLIALLVVGGLVWAGVSLAQEGGPQAVTSRVGQVMNGHGFLGGPPAGMERGRFQGGPWQGHGPAGHMMTIVAEQLDMTPQELLSELQSGKTVADVAAEKGVSLDTIVEAVVAPRLQELEERVNSGDLTQEQADAMAAVMRAEIREHLTEPFQPGPNGEHAGPGQSPIAIAAEQLGMTRQELVTELRSGKTVADVAEEKGVDLQVLIEAAVAPKADHLNELVAEGSLTQEQADTLIATATGRIATVFTQPFTPGQGMGFGHGAGHGFGQGHGPQQRPFGDCDGQGPHGRAGRWGGRMQP